MGPGVLGLLDSEGLNAGLGAIGLLYLVFAAGLELDLVGFARNRRPSLAFGAMSFLIPGSLAYVVARRLGFDVPASLLWTAAWGSHTLLTYPVFRRFGMLGTRVVAIGVPATLVTDTTAILILGGVASFARNGRMDALFGLSLALGLVVLVVFTLVVLPRLARRFFLRTAHDRTERFLFLLAGFFLSAALADAMGVAAVLGAFLAGLGLNRLTPSGSALMVRVEALGSGLLIPAFLVFVGTLINPFEMMGQPSSLVWGLAFALVAIGGKWAAAEGVGRILSMSGDERLALFGLTGSQAAAALATAVIGTEVGLLPTEAVNAVVVVVLLAASISALVTERAVPRLSATFDDEQPLGRTVVVAVANPAKAAALTRVAAALAAPDSGLVVPVAVVLPGCGLANGLNRLAGDLDAIGSASGVEVEAVIRVDATPEEGILHSLVERNATSLVMGWSGHSVGRFRSVGTTLGEILDQVSLPTIVARIVVEQPQRIVLSIPDAGWETGGTSITMAATVAQRVAKAWEVELFAGGSTESLERSGLSDLPRFVGEPIETDLVVAPAPLSVRALDRVATLALSEAADASLLMCVDAGTRIVGSTLGAFQDTWEVGLH